MIIIIVFFFNLLNDKEKRSKYLVLGPSARRTFQLLSRTLLRYLSTSCPDINIIKCIYMSCLYLIAYLYT